MTMITDPVSSKPAGLIDKGDQYLDSTALATAVGLTVPTGARVALIQCEGQAVRWRNNAQTPTSTIGIKLDAGDSIFYIGELDKIRFIQTAAGASISIQYYW